MAGIIGVGVGLLGAGTSAAGSAKSASKEKRIAGFNTKVAEAQAEDALTRGREAEDQLRSGVRKLVGSQRASFAAQGVELDSGSPLAVLEDTAAREAEDIARIRLNAGREAWGFKQQATNYSMGGSAQYNMRMSEGYGTILGGLGNAFSNYATVRNNPINYGASRFPVSYEPAGGGIPPEKFGVIN